MMASLMDCWGGEGVHREHRVRVAVFDDRKIRGEHQTFDSPTVDHDAAGLPDLRGHFQNVMPQAAFHIGHLLLLLFHDNFLHFPFLRKL